MKWLEVTDIGFSRQTTIESLEDAVVLCRVLFWWLSDLALDNHPIRLLLEPFQERLPRTSSGLAYQNRTTALKPKSASRQRIIVRYRRIDGKDVPKHFSIC